jgi:hypothetical protein
VRVYFSEYGKEEIALAPSKIPSLPSEEQREKILKIIAQKMTIISE